MKDLLVMVVSWNRPLFLTRTLASLLRQTTDLDAEILVADNGSDVETLAILDAFHDRIDTRLLKSNHGINGAFEQSLPPDLAPRYRYVLFSDADMLYRRPLSLGLQFLESDVGVAAVSFQNSPEHSVVGECQFRGESWPLKKTERGCALLLATSRFASLRPLPVHKAVDFDWWVLRDAPDSLAHRGEKVAVVPGGAFHLGWRQGDSTWQAIETPEFAECKL